MYVFLIYLFVVYCQNGEQQRWSTSLVETGQVPASSARKLCPFTQVRVLWEVVCQHRQRQSAECLANSVWSQHLSGEHNALHSDILSNILVKELYLYSVRGLFCTLRILLRFSWKSIRRSSVVNLLGIQSFD